MFVLTHRTDVLPEMRTLVNTDQIVAVVPVEAGARCKLYLVNGEVWEVSLSFIRAMHLLRVQPEMVEPMIPRPAR